MKHSTPTRTLALNFLKDEFGDLITSRAVVPEFEREFIASIYDTLWLEDFDKKDRTSQKRTVRVAYLFLEKGFQLKPEKVSRSFFNVVNQIGGSLNRSSNKRREVKNIKITNFDQLIEGYLNSYKTLYEGLLPLIMSPIVYAFSIYKRSKQQIFTPRNDGKISLNAIKKMEKWLIYPQNQLAIGLNSHVRNAYSHEHFRILDFGKVELWDIDPRNPKKKWGPEIWSIDDLKNLYDKLFLNSLGITLSLMIFSCNYRLMIKERGWQTPISIHALRIDEVKAAAESIADHLSFDLKNFGISETFLNIHLATRLKGIDQIQDIFMGGGGKKPRRFKVPVKYKETKVIVQAVGFLHRLLGYLDKIEHVVLKIADIDDKEIGQLSIDIENLKATRGPDKQDLDTVRNLFRKDTIGDSKMFIKIEGTPIEV